MARSRSPRLSADCIAIDESGRVLLIRRGRPPFEGSLALPGGFVEAGETVEDACRRELLEETGVRAGKLILVGVYSEPGRDPRGASVSVAFLTRVRGAKAEAGDDAAAVEWMVPRRGLVLAFDHAKILSDGLALVRNER